MTSGDARRVAAGWVQDRGRHQAGFVGAYLAGSILDLPDGAPLPDTSDVDVNVVVEDGAPVPGRYKVVVDGVLVEVSTFPRVAVATPEAVLGHYHLAGGFRRPGLLADPTGHLDVIRVVVEREFAADEWVRRRCMHARDRIVAQVDALDVDGPWHDIVLAWLFATGVTAHVPLVAALRNPTVRRRYAAVRPVMEEAGHGQAYAGLLSLLGVDRLDASRVEAHLEAVAATFDVVAAVLGESGHVARYPFGTDLTRVARALSIDGSRTLIADGMAREAAFWIAVTGARCLHVLAAEAPALLPAHAPAFRAVTDDLGLASPDHVRQRAEAVRACLPGLWEVAMAITGGRR